MNNEDEEVNVHDVRNTIAYTYLDSMLAHGRVSADLVDNCKNNYKRLHNTVLQCFQNERNLLDNAKDLASKLEEERSKIEVRITESQGTQAEIDQQQQEADEVGTIVQTFHNEISTSKFEQEELQSSIRENEAIRSQNEAKHLNELIPIHDKQQMRFDEITMDSVKYKEATVSEQEQSEVMTKKIEALTQQCGTEETHLRTVLRTELEGLYSEPDRLRSQIQQIDMNTRRLRNEVTMLERTDNKLDQQVQALLATVENNKNTTSKYLQLMDELNISKVEIEKIVNNNHTQNQDISDQVEAMKQKASEQKVEEKALRDLVKQCVTVHNEHQHEQKLEQHKYNQARSKYDRGVVALQQLTEQLNELRLVNAEIDERLKIQTDRLNELKRDEELFTAEVLNQEKLEEDARSAVENAIVEKRLIENRIAELQTHEKNLKLYMSKLVSERDSASREISLAKGELHTAVNELQSSNRVLESMDRASYDISVERARVQNQVRGVVTDRRHIQKVHHTLEKAVVSLTVKLRSLANEHSVAIKEYTSREAARRNFEKRLSGIQSCYERSEQEKLVLLSKLDESKKKRESSVDELHRLVKTVKNGESKVKQLSTGYINTVDNRNLISLRLIDKNDELALILEQGNVLKQVLLRGDEKMHTIQQKLRNVKLDITELRRKVELKRTKLPSLAAYTAVINTIQYLEADLSTLQGVSKTLSTQLEGGDNSMRLCRVLGGTDLPKPNLENKAGVLRQIVKQRTEQVAERELLLGALNSLGGKLRVQAAEVRGAAVETATRLSDLRSRLRKVGKQLMGAVGEQSQYQATAAKLFVQREEVETAVVLARERLQKGQAPTDDAEFEWFRQERDRVIRKEALQATKANSKTLEDEVAAGLVVRTTAEPRPNHYVGDEGQPKPFGNMAPFRPNALGATMRHTRKPQPREVVL